jgi:hypothetical protein
MAKAQSPIKIHFYVHMIKTSTVQWDCEPEPCCVVLQHLHHKQAFSMEEQGNSLNALGKNSILIVSVPQVGIGCVWA